MGGCGACGGRRWWGIVPYCCAATRGGLVSPHEPGFMACWQDLGYPILVQYDLFSEDLNM